MVLNKTSDTESGSAAIEFVLLAPLVLLILFGIINFGILMFNQSVITNAAREGARWASIHSSPTYGNSCSQSYSATPIDPCQTAYSYAYNLLISFNSSPNLTITYTATSYNLGTPQTVTVNYGYQGIGWYFSDNAIQTYTSSAVMLHE